MAMTMLKMISQKNVRRMTKINSLNKKEGTIYGPR